MGEPENQPANLYGSFAEAVATLDKLTKIELKVATGIEKSHVPWKESRKFLKCMTPEQMSNTTLLQFMQTLFRQMGLGKLEILDVGRFQLTFCVKECGICKIYRTRKSGKVCFIITDAILNFFVKDLDISCSVEETMCIKEGKEYCEFKVYLQPLGVYKIALDDIDRALIGDILGSQFEVKKFAEEHLMDEAEIEYRLHVLESYQIVDKDHKVTEVGSTYFKFAQGLRALEKDFDPPWKSLSEVTTAIAAKDSFAEAISEVLNPESVVKVDASEVVNLADEAKTSKSFAELIAKYMKTMK